MRQVVATAVLLGSLVVAVAAQERSTAQSPVFRSTVSLVALNVTVTDGQRTVSGLTPDDFLVYEDGVPQRIEFFESGDVPVDLIVLIDTSSSMRERMEVVHAAATSFIRTLRPGDRGAIIAFGDTVQVSQGLTSDRAALEEAIRATQAAGGTALHNALYISLSQFGRKARDASDVRRQAFVVLSDGHDTTSLIGFDEVLEQARRTGASIYTINMRSEAEMTIPKLARRVAEAEFAMRQLARETGGQAFIVEHAQQLSGVYTAIADELSSQYSLAYIPSNNRADGAFRQVVVRVVTRPELRARTRTGYRAEGRTLAGLLDRR